MNELIGKKFRRNKYGLSIWEDEIVKIGFAKNWIVQPFYKEFGKIVNNTGNAYKEGYKIEPYILSKSGKTYYINEIIIYP